MAPAVQPLLRDLGVWEEFGTLRSLPSWGIRSIWDEPTPAEQSYLAIGYGSGWHVDRCAFDRLLTDAAARAGAHVWTGTSVAECRHDGAAWDVTCAGGRHLRGRLLIDATGRRAALGRSLGARRLAFDRLVAITTRWDDMDVAREHYLLVESAAEGGWYTAPLPSGSIVGMLMTDADLCRRDGLAGTARGTAGSGRRPRRRRESAERLPGRRRGCTRPPATACYAPAASRGHYGPPKLRRTSLGVSSTVPATRRRCSPGTSPPATATAPPTSSSARAITARTPLRHTVLDTPGTGLQRGVIRRPSTAHDGWVGRWQSRARTLVSEGGRRDSSDAVVTSSPPSSGFGSKDGQS